MNEFDLIAALVEEAGTLGEEVLLGPGDDAALVRPSPDTDLCYSTDTLLEGTHFPPGLPPRLLARRALAVNLSDLAAMGADPQGYLVALVAPELNEVWVRELARGFRDAAEPVGASLIGGNMARGPLAISVTVSGSVPRNRELRRSGALAGDLLYVSGRIGEGARALARIREQTPDWSDEALREDRYLWPRPRVELGRALRGVASGCIDVSDGLLADLGHLSAASGVGARLVLDRVPVDGDAMSAIAAGDDYELLFTVPGERESELPEIADTLEIDLTRIGRMVDGSGVVLLDEDGVELEPPATGWLHFGNRGPRS